jgi:hypothetical protein
MAMRNANGRSRGRWRSCLAWLRVAIAAALISRLGLTAVAQPASDATAGGKFPQRVYVWQRTWTPSLCRSLKAHAGDFAAIDILAAEIGFLADGPKTFVPTIDWAALRELHVPVALTVRVGPSDSVWTAEASETQWVIAVCRQSIADARSHGIEPSELQIDYDAATSRLADYVSLAGEVRRAVAPRRLVITALPTWLRSREFRTLARSVDAYVLQEHSLEKPASASVPCTLCDPIQARRWIEEASAIGRPFRVALPAYGYRVGFAASGQFVGLQAEGPARPWPSGAVVRTLWPDAAQMAALCREITSVRPAYCEAIVWFRFPSEVDELSWRWVELAAVKDGIEPRPHLVLDPATGAEGTIELRLRNDGTADAEPEGFQLNWHGARLIAADGIHGWRIERRATDRVVIHATTPAESSLRPGDSFAVGWLRLDAAVPITSAPIQFPCP